MGEKTEKATPKRKKDSREKEGNVLQSKEIMIAISVLGIFWVLSLVSGFMYAVITTNLTSFLIDIGEVGREDFSEAYIKKLTLKIAIIFFSVVGPLLVASFVFAILPVIIQTKGFIGFKSLRPKFSKLNPFTGFKRLFSLQSLIGILKAILEIIVICAVTYTKVKDMMPKLAGLSDVDLIQSVVFTGKSIVEIAFTIAIFLVFVAAGDYIFQWWQYEKKLMMTKQEIKDEYKNIEGDPAIKQKIKQKQREMSQRRMMQDVPSSDVVIRNPTHYAVAIKYNIKAPIVLAKGQDAIALKIIEIAEQNDIYIVEDRPLARELFEKSSIGKPILPHFFKPVAAVMVELFQLTGMSLDDDGNLVKTKSNKNK